ncbi:hypothetical protein GCM10009764_68300 [Nocardia ninae]|uniref:Uncharacterized protein n=1 Tax=Nocardia ninae NBRC 108245 TaxID=1210091 RepID=A0A511MB86_9NOCA|nr:hypothetical protein NN4_23780 [Nocardia ninae NBRC 108245]
MGFNWWREAEPDGMSVQEIVDRVQAEWRAERRRVESHGTGPGPHDAPDQPLTVSDAHWTMQRHRGCRIQDCPRKAAARQVLIAAGRMSPDPAREY